MKTVAIVLILSASAALAQTPSPQPGTLILGTTRIEVTDTPCSQAVAPAPRVEFETEADAYQKCDGLIAERQSPQIFQEIVCRESGATVIASQIYSCRNNGQLQDPLGVLLTQKESSKKFGLMYLEPKQRCLALEPVGVLNRDLPYFAGRLRNLASALKVVQSDYFEFSKTATLIGEVRHRFRDSRPGPYLQYRLQPELIRGRFATGLEISVDESLSIREAIKDALGKSFFTGKEILIQARVTACQQ